MHMTSVRIDFGVRNHRRDRVERSFSRSIRVVCLQSSLALDQRRRLESGYKHGQVRFHLSDDNAARFVVKIEKVMMRDLFGADHAIVHGVPAELD